MTEEKYNKTSMRQFIEMITSKKHNPRNFKELRSLKLKARNELLDELIIELEALEKEKPLPRLTSEEVVYYEILRPLDDVSIEDSAK